MLFQSWRAIASAAVVAALFASSSSAASVCNGHAEFCARTYSNVSIIGAHNSYGVGADNVAANQNYSITTQLNNGIRMLQVQGHLNNGSIHLCHSSCFLLDAGTFTSYLQTVKSWLDSNPNEVITLLLVNTDGIPAATWAASYTSAGLSNYVYTPSSVPISYGSWPTYGELIDAGTRVVSFLAQQADNEAAPFLMDEFTNIWETPYDETETSFPCTVDRVTGSSQDKMYLMNHFLDRNVSLLGQIITVPATTELNQTNAATGTGSLGAQASTCFSEHGYYPTFTLVDYYDVGNGSVFQYAAKLNGVAYTPVAIGNSTSKGSSGSKSSSTAKATASSNSDGTVTSTPLGGAAVKGGVALGTLFLGTIAGLTLVL